MKIEMTTAGGFAPALMARRYEVVLDELSPELQKQVRNAVEEAVRAPAAPPNPHLRDARSHSITVTESGRSHTIEAVEGATPTAVANLVQLVKNLSSRK